MLFRGKYLIGHILVIAIAISCFFLSSWQFSRLSERKDLNRRIESRMDKAPAQLSELRNPVVGKENIKELEYRRVNISGNYDQSIEILISGRSRDGAPGYNVVTLLNLKDEQASIFVNRGWIPQSLGDEIRAGKVDEDVIAPKKINAESLVGIIRLNEREALFADNKQVDDERISTRIDTTLFQDITKDKYVYQFYVQLLPEQNADNNAYPIALDQPELTERNHLSYAMQWLIFGIIAIITWVVICVKSSKKKVGKNS